MSESSKIIENSILKSILLLLGSYTFIYCLGLTFHETEHALAYTIFRLSDVRIYVHPFALSYTSVSLLNPEMIPFTGSMGSLFNLLCSSIITLTVWCKHDPKLLPFVMCAEKVFTAECTAIFIDIINLPLLIDYGKVMIIGGFHL